jgi:hypothetical protein
MSASKPRAVECYRLVEFAPSQLVDAHAPPPLRPSPNLATCHQPALNDSEGGVPMGELPKEQCETQRRCPPRGETGH